MNQFVQRIVAELKTNESLKNELLVKMLTESIDKSIALNESESAIYNSLKVGVVSLNEKIKSPVLESILLQFAKNEETPESKVYKLANEINFENIVRALKESAAYANPIIKTQVDGLDKAVATGTPGFSLCLPFIQVFEQYSHDKTVGSCVESVKSYISKNRAKLSVISTIYQLDSMKSPAYAGVSSDLKSMLLAESYSADILKLKYNTSVPLVTNLINDLRLIESQETGSFTLGEGNGDTQISNLIAPAIKTEDGLIMYVDNRFLSIRESKGLNGTESKIHIDENFKIADIDPNYVKSNYSDFYQLCEAYVNLGFTKTADGLGVETSAIKNFKLGLRANENKEIEFYINDSKVNESNDASISEALALQPTQIQVRVARILENTKDIFNFEFIKEVTNDRTLSEALVFNLNSSYYVCDKVNAADRVWKKVDENELYHFIGSKFNYDISKIFKVKIDEAAAINKEIETQKQAILENISKLESSITKLDDAANNPNLDPSETKYFVDLKESITGTINKLKEEYISLDLLKKK